MPLSHHGRHRTHRQNIVLAFALALVAGGVNAIGFIELGEFTSNVSGTGTRLGTAVARNDHHVVTACSILLLSFLCGAMTATLFVERARLARRARYVVALLLEAGLLTAIAVALELFPQRPELLSTLLVGALSFSMGLQNALVTHISGAVIRTTHLTGIVTDIGIESVRVAFAFRERIRQQGWDRIRAVLRELMTLAEFQGARLHVTIFLSFLTGGALGTLTYLYFGRVAMATPVCILLALVAYDKWVQRQGRPPRMPERHSETETPVAELAGAVRPEGMESPG